MSFTQVAFLSLSYTCWQYLHKLDFNIKHTLFPVPNAVKSTSKHVQSTRETL